MYIQGAVLLSRDAGEAKNLILFLSYRDSSSLLSMPYIEQNTRCCLPLLLYRAEDGFLERLGGGERHLAACRNLEWLTSLRVTASAGLRLAEFKRAQVWNLKHFFFLDRFADQIDESGEIVIRCAVRDPAPRLGQ